MFDRFSKFFGIEERLESKLDDENMKLNEEMKEFFSKFEGSTFAKGLYRIHRLNNIKKWNSIVTDAFPEFSGRICCFGYDWLGRQFAIDKKRTCSGKPLVLMFEPGTADVLEIPCDFVEFHEVEIVEYHDACLASSFFKQWRNEIDDVEIESTKCIGYKVPLFLGGEDTITNLELSDMDVYWTICSELIKKTK